MYHSLGSEDTIQIPYHIATINIIMIRIANDVTASGAQVWNIDVRESIFKPRLIRNLFVKWNLIWGKKYSEKSF